MGLQDICRDVPIWNGFLVSLLIIYYFSLLRFGGHQHCRIRGGRNVQELFDE